MMITIMIIIVRIKMTGVSSAYNLQYTVVAAARDCLTDLREGCITPHLGRVVRRSEAADPTQVSLRRVEGRSRPCSGRWAWQVMLSHSFPLSLSLPLQRSTCVTKNNDIEKETK